MDTKSSQVKVALSFHSHFDWLLQKIIAIAFIRFHRVLYSTTTGDLGIEARTKVATMMNERDR
jgi:hypothetical protein